MNLYEIAAEYRAGLSALEAMDDLPEEVLRDTLEGMDGDLNAKCLAIASFIKNLEAEAEAVGKAASDMSKRKSVLNNKAEGLRAYLLSGLKLAKVSAPIKNSQLVISIAKNPAKVVIDDEKAIADYGDAFMTIIPEQKVVDKDAIKTALKAGQEVKGAHLEQGERVNIK